MNPQPALSAATFQPLILEEMAIVDLFIDVLKREQQALVEGHADLLTSLAAEKTDCYNRLDRLGRKRQLMLTAAGMAAVPASLTYWLESQALSLQETWQAFLLKAGEARDLNRQNGELINSHMQYNRQALTVLLEISNRASVYGPDGQPRPSGGGRILGKC